MNDNGKVMLCDRCIEAIRSRGEKVFVGESHSYPDYDDDKLGKCEWCEDDECYELFECLW